ncbi:MAG: glutamate--tRNA ligase, partial [Gemmatimonadetes bacterium]|nr:glutamate--tRNA ligase [Gemmatimonadota bacterium]
PASELERRRAAAEAAGTVHAFRREDHLLPAAEVAERLARGEPHAIRFRVPEGVTEWEDAVHGRIAFPNADIEDFIILRSDGTPVYNMAVVSDDIAMRITLVMRGDDHISNTPKQILLYRALGAPLPTFAHVPMIHGADGKKLSKRHGATAVGDYQHLGIVPSAMVNFLALLGWSPGDDTEVMDRETLVRRFSLDGLQKKAAVFDTKKLEWMNGQHLASMPIADLARLAAPRLAAAGMATEAELADRHDWFCQLLEQLRVRARLLDELVPQAAPFFGDTVAYEPEAVDKQWRDAPTVAALLEATADRLATLTDWEPAAMEGALRALAEERGVSGGKIFQPLRVALTGRTVSPGIFEVLQLLGRDRGLARIRGAVTYLRG